tara:strand:- start:393 stop:2018 length:1626 start_codon:yes stop_codon:yes gene_type:complete
METKTNITKLMSGLLVLLTLLVPVSATHTTIHATSSTFSSGSGFLSVSIDNPNALTTDDAVVPITLDLQNTHATIGTTVTLTLSNPTGGSALSATQVQTVSLPAATTTEISQTIYFALANSGLATGTHTIDVAIAVAETGTGTPAVTMTGATGQINLTVNPAVPAERSVGIVEDNDYDDEVTPGDILALELDLENTFNEDYEDVVVTAYIQDASEDRVSEEVETSEFNLDDEEEETISFNIAVPEDLETGSYTIFVSVESDQGTLEEITLPLTVERDDHSIRIMDVRYDSTADAGETVDVSVRLLNNGEKDEENVRITVTVAGVSQSSNTFEIEEDEQVIRYFTLVVPSGASGDESLTVDVSNSRVSESYRGDIEVASSSVSGTGLTASVNSASQTVGSEGAAYNFAIANNGNEVRTLQVSVAGVEGWADASVTPSAITLTPGSSGIVSVFLSPASGAEGTHAFTAYVQEGTTVLSSVGLTASVEGADSATDVEPSWIVAAILLVALSMVLYNQNGGRTTRRRTATSRRRTRGKKSGQVYY